MTYDKVDYFIWGFLITLHSIQKGACKWAMATMWSNNKTWPTRQDRHLIVSCMPHFTKSFMPLKWAAKSCKRGHGKDMQRLCLGHDSHCMRIAFVIQHVWDLLKYWSPKPPQRQGNETQEEQRSFWIEKFGSCAASKPWLHQDFQSFGSKDACLLQHLTSSDKSLFFAIEIPGN